MTLLRHGFSKSYLRYALKEFGTVAFIEMLRPEPPSDVVLILDGQVVYRTDSLQDAFRIQKDRFPASEYAICETKTDPEVELAKREFLKRKYAQEVAERDAKMNSVKARKKAA